LEIHARLWRLDCPTHGVRVEGVPFARHGSGFTRDFEAFVAWLATRIDKTTVKRMVRNTDTQATSHRKLRRAGGEVWRAYTLKEALGASFTPGLSLDDVVVLIDRFTSRAARSRLQPFTRLGQTIQKHRDGILAAGAPGDHQRPPKRSTTRSA
jgi:hypothetical protein